MVEYMDESILAQLGAPDMRTPIAVALAYPDRMTTTGHTLDWTTLSTLTFEKPDLQKFRAIQLAYDCLNAQAPLTRLHLMPPTKSAVQKFLGGQICVWRYPQNS